MVPLERRQVRGAHEALRAVVELAFGVEVGSRSTSGASREAKPPNALGQQVGRVGVVAAEELVAALAGERDLHVLRRELRHEVGRQRRRVRERLVERVGERGEEQRRVGRRTSSWCTVP